MIVKNIILSSLSQSIFNCVFTCENTNKLWMTIKENNEDSKDVSNERYDVLIDKLNSFKKLDNENIEAMYSRLNVLMNEINALGVNHQIHFLVVRVFLNE